MAVKKTQRPKRRYIVFTLDTGVSRDNMIARFRALRDESAPYVVQCSEGWAIVRCQPKEVDDTLKLILDAFPGTSSRCVSGTLRTLRQRYPILKETCLPARR